MYHFPFSLRLPLHIPKTSAHPRTTTPFLLETRRCLTANISWSLLGKTASNQISSSCHFWPCNNRNYRKVIVRIFILRPTEVCMAYSCEVGTVGYFVNSFINGTDIYNIGGFATIAESSQTVRACFQVR